MSEARGCEPGAAYARFPSRKFIKQGVITSVTPMDSHKVSAMLSEEVLDKKDYVEVV